MADLALIGDGPGPRPAAGRRLDRQVVIGWGFLLLAAANVVVIVVLWARGGNVSGVHTIGQFWTSVSRITGLLAAYLLLIQVLLLARLPPLDRLIGFDRLTVWHRRNGMLLFYLIVAHVVFVTVGYASTDRVSISREITLLLTNYPGMVTATIGTAFLILVIILSLVIVRRHLRYEAWYLVHLTVYAGIVLAWFHQFPTGNEFITNSAASTYWIALYIVTLALVVLFRIAQPAIRSFWHRLRVAEVYAENPNTISLRITGHHLDRLGARPGQFFLWRFLDRHRWWEAHPFSLSAAPDGRSLRITVKNSGDFTCRIGGILPGTPVIAEGPFGIFTDVVRRRERVALIAGGIGITPIRALVEEMEGDLILIYRALSDEDLVFRGELERIGRQRGITLHFLVGDHRDPACKHFLCPDHLCELIPDIADRDIYLCGPPAMMRLLERNVRAAGVLPKYIHTERFALAD